MAMGWLPERSMFTDAVATIYLAKTVCNEIHRFIPASVMNRITAVLTSYIRAPTPEQATIVIDELISSISRNLLFDSAEVYLGTKISPKTQRFKVNQPAKNKGIFVTVEKGQLITDTFGDDEIKLEWRLVSTESKDGAPAAAREKRVFELSFHVKYRDIVLDEYLPFVAKKADEIKNRDTELKLFSRGGGGWGAVDLDHPSTFDTLAMDPEMKKALIQDLDRFLRRRDYYKKVGKAWKRGYLLYGPPGTGKSSLIAAMANYLKFNIYDLELTSLFNNAGLRKVMMSTTNRSIVVIEDIDCSAKMQTRDDDDDSDYGSDADDSCASVRNANTKVTLSGMLNVIDGLWSCLGEERIIIFTTNHKEKLDPALLRPGRMDMHIHMSYCTAAGFRILASNYLGIGRDYDEATFDEIEGLIERCNVTPAELAEELMRSEDADADAALQGVRSLLNNKVVKKDFVRLKDDDDDDDEN